MDVALDGGAPSFFFHVRVVSKASSVWLLEFNAVIWQYLCYDSVLYRQVSLFLWLSSRLATNYAPAESIKFFVHQGR